MIVFLDRQHVGKPNNWDDVGAVSPTDITEVWLTQQYIQHAEWRLRDLGVDVCVLSDGTYSERHERVNTYARGHDKSVYIACHINAGGGTYCATFYDYRSVKGESLAECINRKMGQRCQIENTKALKAKPDDWTKNAYYTIKGVGQPVAVCFEPFFIDSDVHTHLLTQDGLKAVGLGLADGIKLYLDTIQ